MSCTRPLRAFRTPSGVVFSALARHDIIAEIELPCGRCQGCRLRRATDWSLRVMHEAQLWERNCFVTLTYGRDCLPPDGSLCHADFQKFMKRLRKVVGFPVRYYMCGEYGPKNLRPHYHACLFNLDFDDKVMAGKSESGQYFYSSALLDKVWSHGIATVQPLVRQTAHYAARYIMQKRLGKDSESAYEWVDSDGCVHKRVPEYNCMSLKPGIGARWFAKYKGDIYTFDHAVADGQELQTPRYYDRLMRKEKDVLMDEVEFNRVKRAQSPQCRFENTDERRKVREQVAEAKLSTLKRSI